MKKKVGFWLAILLLLSLLPVAALADEMVKVEGKINWLDNNNQDGIRPNSVVVHILKNGQIQTSKAITAGDHWAFSFDDLPKYDNGQEIRYSTLADAVNDYVPVFVAAGNYDITLSHVPEQTKVEGEIVWNDNNDLDGKRPGSVNVQLMKGGSVIQEKTITDAESWKFSFDNLPKNESGNPIAYSVSAAAVEGYHPTYGEAGNHDITFTPTVSITAKISWQDNNNQDGIRPEKVTVVLTKQNVLQSGQQRELHAGNNWETTYSGLPLDPAETNQAYYSVFVESVTLGYQENVSGNMKDGYTITLSHSPSLVDIVGQITWDDANDQDGKRPQSLEVQLLKDGAVVDTKRISAAENWKAQFDSFSEYENGQKIAYTVALKSDVPGYASAVSGYDIRLSYTPGTVSGKSSLTWDDNNDQDGKRPASVEVQLLKNGTVVDTKTTSAADGWTADFGTLPEYENGQKIAYAVALKSDVPGYASAVSGYDIRLSYAPGTVSGKSSLTWDDNNDQDGKRPASVEVQLLKNGAVVDTKTVSAADGWTADFGQLPEYENGQKIAYAVALKSDVPGYAVAASGYDICLSYAPGTVSGKSILTWDDNNDQDGKRPQSVEVQLLKNGAVVDTKTTSAADGWTADFGQLPEYESGQKIAYSLAVKDAVSGYTAAVSGLHGSLSHTPSTVPSKGTIAWNDNQPPASIEVQLLKNGVVVATKTISAADGWTVDFGQLPEYENGQKITYSLAVKTDLPGYTANGFSITFPPAPACKHLYSRYADNGDGTHQRICVDCGAVLIAQEAHAFTAGKCACGALETYTIPQTGDKANLALWLALTLASLGGMITLRKKGCR